MSFTRKAKGDPNDTELCKRLWPALADKVYLSGQYMTLATCVRSTLNTWRYSLNQLSPGIENIGKVFEAMDSIRKSPQMPRESLVEAFKPSAANLGNQDCDVQNVISLTASLATMTMIQINPEPNTFSGPVAIWNPTSSLGEAVSDFYQPTPDPELKAAALDTHLTACSLAKFQGYTIVWADFLNEHLRIDEELRLVWIFQHKIWLSSQVGRPDCLVPQSVLLEALDTLNVLLPPDDDHTRRFLQRREQEFYSLGYCGRVPSTDLKKYAIWGTKMDRLLSVAKGPRRGIWQFLPTPDRFNVLESANFVIACVALVFSIVGFVLGLVSIIYAKLSYQIGLESIDISKVSLDVSNESPELTRLQYLLSVAQACSDPDQARLLPDFCSAEA
ncbi:hypothetical protein Landi51_03003 [Colletotrichum acutatum]